MSHELTDLLGALPEYQILGPQFRAVGHLQFDSRRVELGDVYIATRGYTVDGHHFIPQAIQRGAKVIVCETPPDTLDPNLTYIVVGNARVALAHLANAYFDYPSTKLRLFGVTGTNGKTTVASLMYQYARLLGLKAGLLSTIGNYVDNTPIPATHTTADAIQICSLMADMVSSGCTHCFMEVTSHALDQHRTTGLCFDVAIFTNLTHDHLDYHKTMAAYAEAKKKFFDTLSVEACAYLNFDDPYHAYMSSDTSATVHTFGKLEDASDRLCDLQVTDDGVSFRLHDEEFSSRLYGEFNAFNIAAAALALSTEFPLRVLACHTSSLTPIAGRLQRINSTGSVRAFVDFAHTPDALEKVLTALQPMLAPEGRLITVLGCGGDKDKEKRPVMAALATKHSDHVIITSDNPRSEDPASIIDEMVEGIGPAVAASWLSEPDRRRAIERAVEWARPGDLILVAGKGHEKFQEIAGEKYPFDDVAILERTLRRSTQVGAT